MVAPPMRPPEAPTIAPQTAFSLVCIALHPLLSEVEIWKRASAQDAAAPAAVLPAALPSAQSADQPMEAPRPCSAGCPLATLESGVSIIDETTASPTFLK